MARRQTGTRGEWRTARVELLRLEKEHTRRSDQLARMRRELPWVRIDKPYTFETDDETKTLAQLFAYYRAEVVIAAIALWLRDSQDRP